MGVLVDVAVYPLTLVTTMVGPARAVRAWGWDLLPDRTTVDGTPFRIGSPDLIVAALELEGGAVLRLTRASTSAGPRSSGAGSSSTATTPRSRWATSRSSTPRWRSGRTTGTTPAVPYVREPFAGISWARGVADLAAAIAENRPHRASAEQAAHVVDILDAAARSMAADGRPIEVTSSFDAPALMPWAVLPT